MSNNTAIWDKLGKTDPNHTKGFKRAGGFSGTAIKPMWAFRRMTEEFGPCGVGWGVGEPQFQVVPLQEEVMVYCTAAIWHGSPENMVWGVGGDKVAGKNKYGVQSDDEAFKKAFTDAITNALKLIGVGADVHMGLFDDSKYVAQARREFAEEPARTEAPALPDAASHVTKTNGKYEGLSGPFKTKTELMQAHRDLCAALHAASDEDQLQAVLEEYSAALEQIKKDFPGWWDNTGDVPGISQQIDQIRARFNKFAEFFARESYQIGAQQEISDRDFAQSVARVINHAPDLPAIRKVQEDNMDRIHRLAGENKGLHGLIMTAVNSRTSILSQEPPKEAA